MSFTKPPYSYVLNQDTIMYSGKYNEPLYNEVLGLTNDFLYAVYIYEKEPLCNETFRYSLQILPVPWPLVN